MRGAFPFIGLLSLLRATQTALKVSLSAVDEAFMEASGTRMLGDLI
jgi:hypothetical protein